MAPARSGVASRLVTWATWTLLFVVVAMFCFLVVGPRTGAYHVSVVLSNSMQPEWEAGDIVISRPERPDQVAAAGRGDLGHEPRRVGPQVG